MPTAGFFFDYNLFELLVNRIFFPNPHLRLKMLGGGVLAWLQQDWKVQYFDGTGGDTTIRNQWWYTAGGLRAGIKVDWFWGSDVYFTFGTTFALYMGSYKNLAKQTTSFRPLPTDEPALPVRNSYLADARPAYQMQFSIGPTYEKGFKNSRFEFFTGYELNGWFNLQEIRRSSDGSPILAKETWSSTSMLALQGLTVRCTLDF